MTVVTNSASAVTAMFPISSLEDKKVASSRFASYPVSSGSIFYPGQETKLGLLEYPIECLYLGDLDVVSPELTLPKGQTCFHV
jgi:hypothetical protein